MLSETQVETIRHRIEVASGSLNDAMFAEYYANPFWEARFGERGRRRTREDNLFHLKYFITALSAGDIAIFADYWKWLRPMLVLRGISTRHVREFIEVTERHLRPMIADFWPEVDPYFEAAYAAMAYEHPACQALNVRAEAIAAAVSRHLLEARPATVWTGCRQDNQYLLSYLMDAAANQAPRLYRDYLTWIGGFLAGRGIDPSDLSLNLEFLRAEIAQTLPPQPAAVFLEML